MFSGSIISVKTYRGISTGSDNKEPSRSELSDRRGHSLQGPRILFKGSLSGGNPVTGSEWKLVKLNGPDTEGNALIRKEK